MAGVFQGLGVDGPRERRERREDAVRYLVRLELADVSRPVVRTVELPSDMILDEVSDVVQAAYGWLDYHLHRFATGDPFAPGGEVYLCPFEVDDGEDGLDARGIRLDELLASPGDTCRYAYDYGDGWEVELRLLDVLPAAVADGPRVRCRTGEGAPPPEDSGGPGGYDDLVADRRTPGGLPFDPDAFDAQQVTRSIAAELGFRRGRHPGVRLERYQWLLDRVVGDGLPLTAAGYLRPVDVRAAFDDWGLEDEWIGTGNREHTVPVWEVREGALALRLVRRCKGRLLLTPLGAQARQDPEVLRAQLGRLAE